MLLELRLENFRSFRDAVVLSMIADAGREHKATHVIEGPENLRVLRTVLLYGANASGKSNVLVGFDVLLKMVTESSTSDQAASAADPFRLEAASRAAPVRLGVTFMAGGVRHDYDVAVVQGEIHEERLVHYPEQREALLFERLGQRVKWGSAIKGKTRLNLIADLLKPRTRTLLLSLLGQFEVEFFEPVTHWFEEQVQCVFGRLNNSFTKRLLQENKKGRRFVLRALRSADVGISNVALERHAQEVPAPIRSFLEAAGQTAPEEIERIEARFAHGPADPEALMSEGDESAGTLALFAVAGPLFDVLENGLVLALDELGRELHPDLVRKLVELFNSPEMNPKGAQLIAATHELRLLDPEFVRRDNIWFAEKSRDGASTIYPLTDFRPRKDDPFGRQYLHGRFGALPALPTFAFSSPEPLDEAPADA